MSSWAATAVVLLLFGGCPVAALDDDDSAAGDDDDSTAPGFTSLSYDFTLDVDGAEVDQIRQLQSFRTVMSCK